MHQVEFTSRTQSSITIPGTALLLCNRSIDVVFLESDSSVMLFEDAGSSLLGANRDRLGDRVTRLRQCGSIFAYALHASGRRLKGWTQPGEKQWKVPTNIHTAFDSVPPLSNSSQRRCFQHS